MVWYLVRVSGCHWVSMGVSGCQGVNGCHWVSLSVKGVIGCQWVSLGIFECQGCHWVSMGVIGCQWVSLGVNWCHWVSRVSMGISGCQWVSMVAKGRPTPPPPAPSIIEKPVLPRAWESCCFSRSLVGGGSFVCQIMLKLFVCPRILLK